MHKAGERYLDTYARSQYHISPIVLRTTEVYIYLSVLFLRGVSEVQLGRVHPPLGPREDD